MAHEVVRTVTQPFHGPDGIEVLYQPGDRVPVDADLPYGVRTTLAVAEVVVEEEPEPVAEVEDKPEPAAEVKDKPKAAAKPPAGKSA